MKLVPPPAMAPTHPTSAAVLAHTNLGDLLDYGSRVRLSTTGQIIGSPAGYASAEDAVTALEHLTAGAAPAAGVVHIDDAYVGVALLTFDWDPGSLRAGRKGHLDFAPARLTGFQAGDRSPLHSTVLEAVVDGETVIKRDHAAS